jgi:hypothetical protein
MNFKKWVKSIQTAGYNGERTVIQIQTNGFGIWDSNSILLLLFFTNSYIEIEM